MQNTSRCCLHVQFQSFFGAEEWVSQTRRTNWTDYPSPSSPSETKNQLGNLELASWWKVPQEAPAAGTVGCHWQLVTSGWCYVSLRSPQKLFPRVPFLRRTGLLVWNVYVVLPLTHNDVWFAHSNGYKRHQSASGNNTGKLCSPPMLGEISSKWWYLVIWKDSWKCN